MPVWSSIRGRALLAGALLTLLLATVGLAAVWRANDDRHQHDLLERRSDVVAAMENARAQSFHSATMITAAVFADDAVTYVEAARQETERREEDLNRARAGLIALGDADGVAAIDRFLEQLEQTGQAVEAIVDAAATADMGTRIAVAQQYYPELWPETEAQLAELDRQANRQQEMLAAEGAAADRSADLTLWLLVGSAAAFFAAAATTVATLTLSVVRPLSLLRARVRGITSGNLNARVEVAGPEELASLARDFNNMVAERKRAEEAVRQSEQWWRSLVEDSPDVILNVTRDGTILLINRTLPGLPSREDTIGMTVYDFSPPEEHEKLRALLERVIDTGEPATYEGPGPSGTASCFECRMEPVKRDGQVTSAIMVTRDVTERTRAVEALRDSEERARLIVEAATDALISMDADGVITGWNAQAEATFGWPRSLALGRRMTDTIIPPDHREAHERGLKRFLTTGEGPVLNQRVEMTALHRDGHQFPVELAVWPVRTGGVLTLNAFVHDITERKLLEDTLREQVRRDPLTGVLNHGAIVEELRRLISDRSNGSHHAVAMADVNGLKAINDACGHQVGDAVLLAVAGTLSRDGALVGRYGGDEFLALLPGADRAAAERYRHAVLSSLADTSLTDPETGDPVAVAASVGLVAYPTEADKIEELVKLADDEMYAAKRRRSVAGAGWPPSHGLGKERAAKTVGELVPLLTAPGNLEHKLRLVSQRLSVGAGYDAVSMDIFRSPNGPAMARNVFAEVPEEVAETWRSEGRGREDDPFVQAVSRSRRALLVDDPQNDERLTERQRDVLRVAGLKSAIVVPLLWQDDLIGTISAASRRDAAFASGDIEFLTAVAAEVTAMVRMATLVDNLQTASTGLAEARVETVMLLAAAAEAHDRTTGSHLRNVRCLAEALARELGYSEDDASELGLAAVLHDIGKIRVPDVVLASTGRLTREEWELMKNHTTWGCEFLAGRPGFDLAATISRSHHERWDGDGYPDGLAGAVLPEAAAIVAVADSFDAMTSDRPYRPARSVAAAVQEITACSGKQFSPRVVAALSHLRERGMLPATRPNGGREEAAA